MKFLELTFAIALLFAVSCSSKTVQKTELSPNALTEAIKVDTLTLIDSARNRPIPIAIYTKAMERKTGFPVVIISHGYNFNKPGSYLFYTYLTTFLARKGYCVVSIQHELPTDELLPLSGPPQTVRRSNWQSGSDNIAVTIMELKKRYPNLNYNDVTLIGHSNGGDMSVLFTHQHGDWIKRLITLDHRRMPLPLTQTPQIYSLRSSDQVADEGVLPTTAICDSLGIIIVPLSDVQHNDMSDAGTMEQKTKINNWILQFLEK